MLLVTFLRDRKTVSRSRFEQHQCCRCLSISDSNNSLYVWYVTTVAFSFKMEVKEHPGADALFSNGDRMASFVSCDAEASLTRVLMSKNAVARLKSVKAFLNSTIMFRWNTSVRYFSRF